MIGDWKIGSRVHQPGKRVGSVVKVSRIGWGPWHVVIAWDGDDENRTYPQSRVRKLGIVPVEANR